MHVSCVTQSIHYRRIHLHSRVRHRHPVHLIRCTRTVHRTRLCRRQLHSPDGILTSQKINSHILPMASKDHSSTVLVTFFVIPTLLLLLRTANRCRIFQAGPIVTNTGGNINHQMLVHLHHNNGIKLLTGQAVHHTIIRM